MNSRERGNETREGTRVTPNSFRGLWTNPVLGSGDPRVRHGFMDFRGGDTALWTPGEEIHVIPTKVGIYEKSHSRDADLRQHDTSHAQG